MAGLFGIGGGKDVKNQWQTTSHFLPGQFQPSYDLATQQYLQAQQTGPTLAEIGQNIPLLNVPNLTPEQQQYIDQIMAQGGTSPYLQQAAQQLQQLTAGPIGSSPATQQAMEAYRSQVVPELLNQQASAGRGSSGAALEAVAQGEQSAMVPLLQQEVQNRANAVSQYGALQGQTMQGIQAALEAAGLPRDVAQQQALAEYQRQQQTSDYWKNLQSMPALLTPSLIGTQTNTRGTGYYSPGWGDWVGAGLTTAGSLANLAGAIG